MSDNEKKFEPMNHHTLTIRSAPGGFIVSWLEWDTSRGLAQLQAQSLSAAQATKTVEHVFSNLTMALAFIKRNFMVQA